jgi:hypothetical protein
MGISVSCLPWGHDDRTREAALFGLGLGWNFSFVAATAVLTEPTEPSERVCLLGFNDLHGPAVAEPLPGSSNDGGTAHNGPWIRIYTSQAG